MKQIIAIFVMALLLITSVSAFRDVRCDEGRFNSEICRDYELQDEFNALEDYVDALRKDSECRDKFLHRHIHWTASKLNSEIDQMEEDLKEYSDINDRRVVAISQADDEDVKAYSDQNDRRVLANIMVNNEKWSKDIVGGGGISMSSFARHLTGNSEFFRGFDAPTFLGYLYTIFADKVELEQAHDRIDMLEARLDRLEQGTAAYTVNSVECEAMLIKANRLGEKVIFSDGWNAYPGDEHCIKFIYIIN